MLKWLERYWPISTIVLAVYMTMLLALFVLRSDFTALPLAILQTQLRLDIPSLACLVEKTYQTASGPSSVIHLTNSSSSRRGVDGNGSALIGAQPTRSSICG